MMIIEDIKNEYNKCKSYMDGTDDEIIITEDVLTRLKSDQYESITESYSKIPNGAVRICPHCGRYMLTDGFVCKCGFESEYDDDKIIHYYETTF